MKNNCTILLLFLSLIAFSQTDYSDRWEDFFSYNNVNEVITSDNVFYALTDNAIFTYDIATQETKKISSINGLSGEQTSSIHFNESNKRLVIGYDNGLVEIIEEDGAIIIAPDIVSFNQTGLKSINHIYEFENKLYLSTAFAVVVYDIENLEFGDTFFIGANSSDVFVNEITILNNEIYAATNNGIYVADVRATNLIDNNNWSLRFPGNYQKVITFNDVVYASSNQTISSINGNSIIPVLSYSETIKDIKASANNLVVSLNKNSLIYDSSLVNLGENSINENHDFTLNTAIINQEEIVLATEEFGLLIGTIGGNSYTEIHPEGPLSNEIFSIDSFENNLWVVYGGYDVIYTPAQKREGYSHYNGENWVNINFDPNNPTTDLVHVTIDETAENRVFISSFGDTNQVNSNLTGGLFEIENNEIKTFYNHLNSPLEDIVSSNPSRVTIRISDTVFDDEGNLWVTNLGVENRLKKLSPSGQWTNYNINDLLLINRDGISEIRIDRNNSKWLGTRGNGVIVFNENGEQQRAFSSEINKGNLPNTEIGSLAIDDNNNVWIGTIQGLVVFNNAGSIFEADTYNAEPVIILQDGVAERLLGSQNIKAIEVDGANNKWFGTGSGGVINTNPSGQTTLASFDTDNSPLPSDAIIKISVDDSTGKVYFVTDKGMVAYNSQVAPFGNGLEEVYAYPNPVLKNNDIVTIDGRNGTHLPENTNVKILDTAGHLVYETNVVEGEQLQGGKVVWNKRNLAGRKVASGIYIVLLSTDDGSESITTKIAIIN